MEQNRNERIDKYAAMCGVSATYFYRFFRQWSGKSPVEYRNDLRLSNAETMLRHTGMQIREIAEVIGFEDPFYFCRLFAKRFGASPQKYRQTWHNHKLAPLFNSAGVNYSRIGGNVASMAGVTLPARQSA